MQLSIRNKKMYKHKGKSNYDFGYLSREGVSPYFTHTALYLLNHHRKDIKKC